MTSTLSAFAVFIAAAIAEIAGCFAVWMVLRQGAHPVWLIGGGVCLALFAWLLTLVPIETAGRAFAVYGGVYIAASLGWLWAVEGQPPDRWDLIGAAVSIAGAAIILAVPRAD